MTFENEENRSLVFVHMPRRSLLFFYGEARHRWKHGIFSWHIQSRRIALTMREPGQDFQVLVVSILLFTSSLFRRVEIFMRGLEKSSSNGVVVESRFEHHKPIKLFVIRIISSVKPLVVTNKALLEKDNLNSRSIHKAGSFYAPSTLSTY